MPGTDNRLTIITVTHNSSAVIGAMLESLPAEFPLIVVDNASEDQTVSIVEDLRPDATVVRNKVGLGYGNGMNAGLRRAATQLVMLTNPDTLLSRDAIETLLQTAESYPEAGLYGPLIRDPSGKFECSYDVELHKRKTHGAKLDLDAPNGPLCVESLSGAVLVARIECLQEINFFDPAFFLYFEDEDMCMQMRRNHHSLIFEPRAVVSHVGGGSIPATAAYHWEKYWHMSWSRLYYEQKYRGRRSVLLISATDLPRFALKAIGYCLILNPRKACRDVARCFGMAAYLMGIPALQTVGAEDEP